MLFYEQEQPVTIEYLGSPPKTHKDMPVIDHFFVVQFENYPVGDFNREKGVLVHGVDPDLRFEKARFVKNFNCGDLNIIETYSIKSDGRKKVFQMKAPKWLGKKLQDAYDGHWRDILKKACLECQTKAERPIIKPQP